MAKITPYSHLAALGFDINNDIVFTCTGLGVKNLLRASLQWLEAHVQLVNNLNVFPVPDGDTGTNLLLTMRSALAEAETASDEAADLVLAQAAHGALMGARGNSGVIFSQFLQGLAAGLAGQTSFTAAHLARAAQQGADLAYQSVMNPVEGTILTVTRAAVEAAQHSSATTQDLAVVLADMVAAAKQAQARTPDLLPILRQAGVTDSGGQGFVFIIEGWQRLLWGEPLPALQNEADPLVLPLALDEGQTEYGYDVQFLIQGEHLNVAQIRARINQLGWSTLVVGDERTVKVHVHTADPGVPLSYGASQGVLNDIVVENMSLQARQFEQKRLVAPAPVASLPALALPVHLAEHMRDTMTSLATICVAPSEGLAQILQSLGASQIVFGGQTMNPSPQEILAAIQQVHANDILILPNNRNVIMAAQQAQKLSARNARVVPTKTIPQGIAALLSLNYQADLDSNARRMLEAAQQVQTVEITRSVRDTALGGFQIKSGDVLGLFNDELVSVGVEDDAVALEVLAQIDAATREIVTIYFGQDSSAERAEILAKKIKRLYPDMEVELHDGGQPYYHYIISLE